MILNRRSILTGAVSSIFMPSLVKADSLMNLRGALLDPWALTFNMPSIGMVPGGICESSLNYDGGNNRVPLSKLRGIVVGWRIGNILGEYSIRRLSECDHVLNNLKYCGKTFVVPASSFW